MFIFSCTCSRDSEPVLETCERVAYMNLPLLLKSFREFCVRAHCVENVDFLNCVSHLNDMSHGCPIKEDYMRYVLAEFVLPNSSREINVSGSARKSAIDGVDRHSSTAFEECSMQIRRLIAEDIWPRFLSSIEAQKKEFRILGIDATAIK
jgi:Regulator of G protein signaling domain